MRKKKSVRGNTVSQDIVQINMKVTKFSSRPIDNLLKATDKSESEGKEEAKEEKPKDVQKQEKMEEKQVDNKVGSKGEQE
jgi:Ran GTPase-activating protein (RanGAP) involved in mRNA processing and transport